MRKKLISLITIALLTLGMCVPVLAMETETDSAGNVFASGDNVTLPRETFFGAFAAGQNIDLGNADAKGSVLAAGQQITGSGLCVGESMYVAGNNVSLNNAEINGNIYAAGASVSMIGNSTGNGVYIAAGNIVFEGTANYLCLAGSHVSINGTIDGDVFVGAETVDISEDTVITGTLTIEAPVEPDVPRSADIGDYVFEQSRNDDQDPAPVSFGNALFQRVKSCLYWMIAMAGFGMILVWFFDQHLKSATNYLKNRRAPLIASGMIGWACIPVAAVILACSYLFAPVAGLLFSAYVFLIWIGLAFSGASLAKLVFPDMNPFLAALIGIAVLEAVRVIPFIGTIVGIAADMYLLGYVIQRLWINRKRKGAVTAADPAVIEQNTQQ